jgi:hypothetical protein
LGDTDGNGEYGKLSKQNCDDIFGVVDVEKLAEKEYPKTSSWKVEEEFDPIRRGFIEGFNKAMELNKDKVFTEEDMILFAEYCRDNAVREGTYGSGFTGNWELRSEQKIVDTKWLFNKFQSTQQPTEIEVTFDPEEKYSNGCLILKRVTGPAN